MAKNTTVVRYSEGSQVSLTKKQIGDAGEMLVAAELTLAGSPAARMPDGWPQYDLLVHPRVGKPQTISVKTRSWRVGGSDFVEYKHGSHFDWLAVVILMPETDDKEYQRYIYLIPRSAFEEHAKRAASTAKRDIWKLSIERIFDNFSKYRDNFGLSQTGVAAE